MSHEFVRIRLRDHGPVEVFINSVENLAPGAQCVVSIDRGQDYGAVLAFESALPEGVSDRSVCCASARRATASVSHRIVRTFLRCWRHAAKPFRRANFP